MESAHEKTRTSKGKLPLAPQASASTNSATCAKEVTWLGLEPRTLSLKGRCSTN